MNTYWSIAGAVFKGALVGFLGCLFALLVGGYFAEMIVGHP